MSRNFELMQELEREQSLPLVEISKVDHPAREGNSTLASNCHWANDKALELVQRVFLLHKHDSPRMTVFAGIDHGSGCSHICASVAEALARTAPGSVCLLEANFRSPGLPSLFGSTNHFGLTNALMSEGPIDSFAKSVGSEKLRLISSGALAAESPNLLTAERVGSRLAELRARFDFVVIDAPPLAHYLDAIPLGRLSDGVVLVLEAESTRKEAARRGVELLRSSNIAILGAVLNKRTFPIPEKLYNWL